MLYDEQGQGKMSTNKNETPFCLDCWIEKRTNLIIFFLFFFPMYTVKEVIYFLVPIAQW